MNKKIWKPFLLLFVCGAIALAAACGRMQDDVQANDPPEPSEDRMYAAIDNGVLIRKDEINQRWLITEYKDQEETPFVDAYWFTLTDQTELVNSQGETVTHGELKVGQRVQAWHTGAVNESYPAQATLAKLVVLEDEARAPADAGVIDAAAAVQAALNEADSRKIWSVKSLDWDGERNVWNVALVEGGQTENEVTVHIDGTSGTAVPEIVMENGAFRLFAPAPESVVNSAFTVTGEANVFEGAFRWTLEDGHHILAEGEGTAGKGTPEWGRFEFEAKYEKASNPVLTLILYTESAKDGSMENALYVPLKPGEETP